MHIFAMPTNFLTMPTKSLLEQVFKEVSKYRGCFYCWYVLATVPPGSRIFEDYKIDSGHQSSLWPGSLLVLAHSLVRP